MLENWQIRNLYGGRVKRDKRVYERKKTGIDGLEQYIINLLDK